MMAQGNHSSPPQITITSYGLKQLPQKTKNLKCQVLPDDGDGRGKRVVATAVIESGEVIFKEPPVVAIGHNVKSDGFLACSHCFTVVGSIEEHLFNHTPDDHVNPKLPLTELFPSPKPVPCTNMTSCPAVYCSEQCRDAAWAAHHSLLCPGIDDAFNEFYHHAEQTNDVFTLSAQAVILVLLQAKKFRVDTHGDEDALEKAWIVFQMPHKALWWDAVALPADVPLEEESQFREDLKELAQDSLDLFTTGVMHRDPNLVDAFPLMFHLDTWGSLIGMFELNNLSMVVSSPVPLWAQTVDDAIQDGTLEEAQAVPALSNPAVQSYGGLEGLMESELDWVFTGNAFYSLQACLNHSCVPNAHAHKRPEDKNGDAVILALRTIQPGEEITISYIEEDGDLNQRSEELRDYGFQCGCERCVAERLAQELNIITETATE